MCGICGIFDMENKFSIQKEQLISMRDIMSHRGPDDAGLFFSPEDGIYLGHRRLKIIDLSPNGHQPMSNEDNTIQIVFNGEIYNFQELRKPLENRGHRFRSNSDTEVLVHLYEEENENMLNYLEGMFAFAIWDKRRRNLFLARDHIGIKPLYYYFDKNLFLFASEIKSIVAFNDMIDCKINYNAIRYYLNYSSIAYPMTIYEKIYKLEPGHFIKINNNRVEKRQFWDPSPENVTLDETTILEHHKNLVIQSVKSHLISDAPLGAFLSGGIDSSIIVSAMSKICNSPVKTFTIGFERASNTMDVELSRLVSKTYRTDHHEFIMNPNISELFEEIIFYLDEPFSVTSAIPTYLNSKFAKKEVDVVLTGDGADEVYAGYKRYVIYKIVRILKIIPKALRRSLLRSVILMLEPFSPVSKFGKARDQILKRMLKACEQNKPVDVYLSLFPSVTGNYPDNILNNEFYNRVNSNFDEQEYVSKYFEIKNVDYLSNLLYFDIKTSLVDEMLTKVDRMTMAHAIEARVPFLNHKLIKFVFSLKDSFKLKGFTNKYLLKETFSSFIPPEVVGASKRGFNVPIDQWLRNELKGALEDLLSRKNLSEIGIFNEIEINDMKDKHLKGKENFGSQLWGLMVLIKWLKLKG